MGFVKTIIPPMAPNLLGLDFPKMDATKVLDAAAQTTLVGLIYLISEIAARANEAFTGTWLGVMMNSLENDFSNVASCIT
jgi:hypothetical protein